MFLFIPVWSKNAGPWNPFLYFIPGAIDETFFLSSSTSFSPLLFGIPCNRFFLVLLAVILTGEVPSEPPVIITVPAVTHLPALLNTPEMDLPRGAKLEVSLRLLERPSPQFLLAIAKTHSFPHSSLSRVTSATITMAQVAT